MAVLSKTLEATTDRSNQHISYMEEISFIQNKLFFETFPAAIVKLRASCAMSSCWEIQYLLTHYLHRKMAVLDSVNHTRMAVPVFESLKEYFKKVNLKDTKVIQHLAVFKTAITSLCFRDNRSEETIFSRAFLNRYECKIKEKLSTSDSDGDEMPVTWKGNQPAEFIPSVSLPFLRLRGGAN